jgi:uncharacterized protein (DUF849 family)
MRKVVLEVRCNEYAMRNRNPHIPFSPAEIAADAAACEAAGASVLHFHARDPSTGAPRHDTPAYADTIRAVRSVCDMPILPTLGATTLQDPAERVQHIIELAKDPATRPDLAPIDLASTNLDPYREGRGFLVEDEVYINSVRGLRTQIAEIRRAEVAVHAVLWNVGSARLLGFVPGGGTLPWLALCAGGSALSLVEAVVERGGHLSLGLGDWHYPELGRPTNAELIDHVVERVRAAGGEPASPAEAREILGLRPLK